MSLPPVSDADVMAAVETAFRWVHVVAGVLWVGLHVAQGWAVGPALGSAGGALRERVLPRLVFLLRFGALYAWAFGVALLFLLYYTTGDHFHRGLTPRAGLRPDTGTWALAFAGTLLGFPIHDALARVLRGALRPVALLLFGAAAVGYAVLLTELADASERAAFVHAGALLGTTMAANVWLRIVPATRRVLEALGAGRTPDPADAALALERARDNVAMSVPLLLLMLSVHQGWLLGQEPLVALPVVLIAGGAAARLVEARVARVAT